MHIGEHIKNARRDRSMTLLTLAQAAGLTKGFISQVEAGKSNPSLASLERIARALGVPLSSLIDNNMGHRSDSAVKDDHGPQLVAARSVYNEQPGLAQLTAMRTGRHFIAAIPATSSFVNEAFTSPLQATAIALCAVLQGSLVIRQSSSSVKASAGEIATWNAGAPYELENPGAAAASALIFMPDACPAPVLVALPQSAIFARHTRAFATQYEGPMRLVGMRARRLNEQGR